jgi:hypothetical protein
MAAEADAYKELLAGVVPLSIADAAQGGEARLFSLDGRWFEGSVTNRAGMLWIDHPVETIVDGMSGEPIVLDDGSAVGVLCNSATAGGKEHLVGGPNPCLTDQLPGWVLRAVGADNLRSAYEQDPAFERSGLDTVAPVFDDSPESGIAELKRQLAPRAGSAFQHTVCAVTSDTPWQLAGLRDDGVFDAPRLSIVIRFRHRPMNCMRTASCVCCIDALSATSARRCCSSRRGPRAAASAPITRQSTRLSRQP